MTLTHQGMSQRASTPARRPVRVPWATVGKYVTVHALGLAFVLFSVLPLLWGVSTALKNPGEVYAFPPRWIPDTITFANFVAVAGNTDLHRAFLNTLVIATITTILSVTIGTVAGYGFSRFRFPGRDTLLYSILLAKLFPRVVVIVPFFVTLRNLQLINSYQGLVLTYLMVAFPVSVWLLKGFFDKIPREIEEAAIVDGCDLPRLLFYVIVPMARPALVAVAMFTFILSWNEFLFALVFTNGLEKRPLSVALAFFIDENGVRWGELMAASILMSLPAILVFTLAQRMLVRGLSDGAVKG